MTGTSIKWLHYITEAIDNGSSDDEINKRIEECANSNELTHKEYCKVYEDVMLAYKEKFM